MKNRQSNFQTYLTLKLIGFGGIDVTKPYKFIGFGDIDATKPYKFIGFGDSLDYGSRKQGYERRPQQIWPRGVRGTASVFFDLYIVRLSCAGILMARLGHLSVAVLWPGNF